MHKLYDFPLRKPALITLKAHPMKHQHFSPDPHWKITLPEESVNAIVQAAIDGNLETFESLAKNGAVLLNTVAMSGPYEGCSLLFIAAHKKHLPLVKLLLDARVDASPNRSGPFIGESPLLAIVRSNDADLLGLSLSAGLDVLERVTCPSHQYEREPLISIARFYPEALRRLKKECEEMDAIKDWYSHLCDEPTDCLWASGKGYNLLSIHTPTASLAGKYLDYFQQHKLKPLFVETEQSLLITKIEATQIGSLSHQQVLVSTLPRGLKQDIFALLDLLLPVTKTGEVYISDKVLYVSLTYRIVLAPLFSLPFVGISSHYARIPLSEFTNHPAYNLRIITQAIQQNLHSTRSTLQLEANLRDTAIWFTQFTQLTKERGPNSGPSPVLFIAQKNSLRTQLLSAFLEHYGCPTRTITSTNTLTTWGFEPEQLNAIRKKFADNSTACQRFLTAAASFIARLQSLVDTTQCKIMNGHISLTTPPRIHALVKEAFLRLTLASEPSADLIFPMVILAEYADELSGVEQSIVANQNTLANYLHLASLDGKTKHKYTTDGVTLTFKTGDDALRFFTSTKLGVLTDQQVTCSYDLILKNTWRVPSATVKTPSADKLLLARQNVELALTPLIAVESWIQEGSCLCVEPLDWSHVFLLDELKLSGIDRVGVSRSLRVNLEIVSLDATQCRNINDKLTHRLAVLARFKGRILQRVCHETEAIKHEPEGMVLHCRDAKHARLLQDHAIIPLITVEADRFCFRANYGDIVNLTDNEIEANAEALKKSIRALTLPAAVKATTTTKAAPSELRSLRAGWTQEPAASKKFANTRKQGKQAPKPPAKTNSKKNSIPAAVPARAAPREQPLFPKAMHTSATEMADLAQKTLAADNKQYDTAVEVAARVEAKPKVVAELPRLSVWEDSIQTILDSLSCLSMWYQRSLSPTQQASYYELYCAVLWLDSLRLTNALFERYRAQQADPNFLTLTNNDADAEKIRANLVHYFPKNQRVELFYTETLSKKFTENALHFFAGKKPVAKLELHQTNLAHFRKPDLCPQELVKNQFTLMAKCWIHLQNKQELITNRREFIRSVTCSRLFMKQSKTPNLAYEIKALEACIVRLGELSNSPLVMDDPDVPNGVKKFLHQCRGPRNLISHIVINEPDQDYDPLSPENIEGLAAIAVTLYQEHYQTDVGVRPNQLIK
jgi:hypothetical protein